MPPLVCPHCDFGVVEDDGARCAACGQPGLEEAPDGPHEVSIEQLDSIVRRELGELFRFDGPGAPGPHAIIYFVEDPRSWAHHRLQVVFRSPSTPMVEIDRAIAMIEQAATLDHPHILAPLRWGLTDSLRWHATLWPPGSTLAERLRLQGPMGYTESRRIIQQVATALDFAHRRGMSHGAVNAEEVLIDPSGWVRVTGIGRAAIDVPSPGPLTPEFFEELAPLGTGPDQPALARLVLACLTGGEDEKSLPEGLAPHLIAALERAMAERPADRFSDLLEFVSALEGPTRIPPPRLTPSAPPLSGPGAHWDAALFDDPPAPPSAGRRKGLLLRSGAILSVLLIATALGQISGRKHRPIGPASLPEYQRPASAEAAPTPPPEPAWDALEQPPDRVRPTTQASAAPLVRSTPLPRPVTPRPAPPPTPVAQAPTALPADTPTFGHLSINSRPWGVLSVDGSIAGNTPQLGLTLTSGRHQLRITRDGFEPHVRWVEVVPGRTLLITDIVLKERAP